MTETETETEESNSVFEDNALLGAFVAFYPSNRARLLISAGLMLMAIWFIVTVALWQVEAATAATITIIVLAAATLGAGWYVTHFWNREIILYERGFSYREGSNIAYIPYAEVRAVQQDGQIVAYFGGLFRVARFKFTVTTEQDEVMTLNKLYKNLDDLTSRLDHAITAALLTQAEAQLRHGERLSFGDSLWLTSEGLDESGRHLPWAQFRGFRIHQGQLMIDAQGATPSQGATPWYSAPLNQVVNIRLLMALLRQRQPITKQQEA